MEKKNNIDIFNINFVEQFVQIEHFHHTYNTVLKVNL